MLKAVLFESQHAYALIMAAAVADFKPAEIANEKIKKDSGKSEISLVSTQDILLEVAQQKTRSGFPHFTIGFAAESENLLLNAQIKMTKKNLDMIVANDISKKNSGFEVDSNQVTFLFKDGAKESLPLLPKNEVADRIIQKIIDWGK
jgi:phosphopantothenoylcysteine decarboxylase/phosphopantothenate--cysteine ligase